jgi:hypothetical protein
MGSDFNMILVVLSWTKEVKSYISRAKSPGGTMTGVRTFIDCDGNASEANLVGDNKYCRFNSNKLDCSRSSQGMRSKHQVV